MGLGGGSSSPAMPTPQPQTPVPQEDSAESVETKRKAAVAGKERDGYSAHLLSDKGYDTSMDQTKSEMMR